jgi:phage repressor protein C with HTH and peptisase S24 domain
MVNDTDALVNGKVNGTDKMPLTNVDQILSRLKVATDSSTDKEFAEFLGLDPQSTTSAKKRGEIPSIWLVRVSHRTNVSMDWLLYGEGPMRRGEVQRDQASPLHDKCLDAEEYVLVPLLESKVTGGPEGEILYEEVSDHLPFKRWWVEKLVGKSPDRHKDLLLVRVRGDSMSPTISQGEVALVDTCELERLQIRNASVYLVVLPDGSVALKRLALIETDDRTRILCMSDNISGYKPFEFNVDPSKQIKEYVLGRVRWAGKEFD